MKALGIETSVFRMRILVTGGRDFYDADAIIKALLPLPEDAVLVHGAAPGADEQSAYFWGFWGRETDPHPADWEGPCRTTCKPGHRRQRGFTNYCPAAGVYRNQEMLDSGIDLVIAFPGGRGTADMVRRVKAAGFTEDNGRLRLVSPEEKNDGEDQRQAV